MQVLKTFLTLLKNPEKKIDKENFESYLPLYEVKIISWILLLAGTAAFTYFLKLKSGLSFGFGGIISIFSFHITEKGILKHLQPNQPSAGMKIKRRYFLKLAAIILIFGIVIKQGDAELVPLLSGLAVVVTAITFYGIKSYIKQH